MTTLLETIKSQLTQEKLSTLAAAVGEDSGKVKSAIDEALPLMFGALTEKVKNPAVFSMIASMVDKGGDGSVIDDVMKMILGAGSSTQDGAANTDPTSGNSPFAAVLSPGMGDIILDTLLGNKAQAVKEHISSIAGLNIASVTQLLPLLAPVIMSALAQFKAQQGISADGLAGAIEKEGATIKETVSPKSFEILKSVLDANKDGNVMDDLLKVGASIFSQAK